MKQIGSMFRVLFATLAVAVFSLPAVAADKHFAESVTAAGTMSVVVRYTNNGNSSFKSIRQPAPLGGYRITGVTLTGSSPGWSPSWSLVPIPTGGGSDVTINAINIPTGTGRWIEFTMTLVAAPTCPAPQPPQWHPATLYTGTPFGSGTTFAYDGLDPIVVSGTMTLSCVPPKLTVSKVVVNDGGGTKVVADFPLNVDGTTAVSSGVQITTTAGAHTVGETGQSAYTAVISGDCAADGSITLAYGQVKSCIITNTFIKPKLTVTKVVENAGGGQKAVADFPLNVDGTTAVTSGVQITTTAGAHTVGETGQSAYTAVISGDCAANGSITLNGGEVKSCIITNTFRTFTLTYAASAGGTVNVATANVGYGLSGPPVTATANSGWRFVKWNDDNSTANPRTDTNVTANATYTAQFGGTLSFTTPPISPLVVGSNIGQVVVACNNFGSTPVNVTLSIDGSPYVQLTGTTTQPCQDGTAIFDNVATGAGTQPGTRVFTATASDGHNSTQATATANATLSASGGVLWCTESGTGPDGSRVNFDSPNPAITLSGTRYPNKDGSPCIAVNFNVQVEVTPSQKKVTILWDEVAQPNLTLKLNVTWPPELVGGDLLPKPTIYNIGLGDFLVGTCLKKNPPYPTDPDNPPQQIGTAASIGASTAGTTETITLAPSAAWPTTYPFSIIIRSDDPSKDPERMLVTGGSGTSYTVVRGTGLTEATAHTSKVVMWTPLPLDKGTDPLLIGINAPLGGQDQVCSISDTYASYAPSVPADPVCPAQSANQEPLPCMRATQKLWAIGDLQMSRD